MTNRINSDGSRIDCHTYVLCLIAVLYMKHHHNYYYFLCMLCLA